MTQIYIDDADGYEHVDSSEPLPIDEARTSAFNAANGGQHSTHIDDCATELSHEPTTGSYAATVDQDEITDPMSKLRLAAESNTRDSVTTNETSGSTQTVHVDQAARQHPTPSRPDTALNPGRPDLSVLRLIEEADHSAGKLVNLLAQDFPCFRDEGRSEGRRVRFLKRAQIFVADLWAAFNGMGYGEFHDISHLTMFAGESRCYLVKGDVRLTDTVHRLPCSTAASQSRCPCVLATFGRLHTPPRAAGTWLHARAGAEGLLNLGRRADEAANCSRPPRGRGGCECCLVRLHDV